jgi:chemotaxis signal transduction protein
MATPSSLRSRRLANRQAEPTEKLVIFPIGTDWFGLRLQHIVHIEPFASHAAIGSDVTLIDLTQRLFPEQSTDLSDQQSYLIRLQASVGEEPKGLVLQSKPTLQRVPTSQFTDSMVSEVNGAEQYPLCSQIVRDQTGFQIFLLDPAKIYPRN